ncbi:AzlD domain-containing protein [Calidifontibacillus erzurumensis]|uniref:AzlD domain-containing protein n=1 Tax=Calidifontibacillus erzurumensis TaxID=2741433 RepID=A0A8J8GDS9_9BACI|nr:AzlD domain-containing protein [Calidifontibacillus erzurumensis]NSL52020.1 AzlD domain-containing protein [Calidifontibacillus erzurumensis]
MDKTVVLMIIGMGIVTYLPRMLPLVVLNGKKMPPFLQEVLRNVPFAALGALIIPGIFFINENIWFGVIGAIAAFLVAFMGASVIVVVMSSIAVLTVFSLFL